MRSVAAGAEWEWYGIRPVGRKRDGRGWYEVVSPNGVVVGLEPTRGMARERAREKNSERAKQLRGGGNG